jgi:hypothetical protein
MAMKIINSVISKIKEIFTKGKYTTNTDAVAIIRRFANRTLLSPYEWDDFETQNEDNPEVDIAIKLIWFFASSYPDPKTGEYCDQKAYPFFFKIADALENGEFKNVSSDEINACLKNRNLSERFNRILGIGDDYKWRFLKQE